MSYDDDSIFGDHGFDMGGSIFDSSGDSAYGGDSLINSYQDNAEPSESEVSLIESYSDESNIDSGAEQGLIEGYGGNGMDPDKDSSYADQYGISNESTEDEFANDEIIGRKLDPDVSLTDQYQTMNSAIKTHLRNDLARTDSQNLDINTLDTMFLDDSSPIDEIIGRRLDPVSRTKIDYQLNSNMSIVNQLYMESRTGYRSGSAGTNDFEGRDHTKDDHWEDISGMDGADWTDDGGSWSDKKSDWTSESDPFSDTLLEEDSEAEEILSSLIDKTKASNETSGGSVFYEKEDKQENSEPVRDVTKQEEGWQDKENWIDDASREEGNSSRENGNKESISVVGEDVTIPEVATVGSVAFSFHKEMEKRKIVVNDGSVAEDFSKEMDKRKIIVRDSSVSEEFFKMISKKAGLGLKEKDNIGNEDAQGGLSEIVARGKVEDSHNEDDHRSQDEQEELIISKKEKIETPLDKVKKILEEKTSEELGSMLESYKLKLRDNSVDGEKQYKVTQIISSINAAISSRVETRGK